MKMACVLEKLKRERRRLGWWVHVQKRGDKHLLTRIVRRPVLGVRATEAIFEEEMVEDLHMLNLEVETAQDRARGESDRPCIVSRIR